MRTIKKYSSDFIAITALALIGLGAAAYVLANQSTAGRFPIIQDAPFVLKAEFSDAQGVKPGQGQTVRIAGVDVGDLAKVELLDGRAIVTMELDPEYKRRIHRDAAALLRPRTGLKDMFVELDPGTRAEPVMKENGMISVRNTAPDVDPDEFLSALDTDTRAYLQLLINGAGKGLEGNGDDLRQVFARFEPLHRDLARINSAVAERRVSLKRLVTNYGSLTTELGNQDQDLVRLVRESEKALGTFAAEEESVSNTIAKLPSALRQTEKTLVKVDSFGKVLGPSLEAIRPAFRRLDVANRQLRPFALEATPILETQIRPFVREARPFVTDLRPAAEDLAQATPELVGAFEEVNRFFNILSYNEGGREELSSEDDTKRDEGYLFWLAWAAHNSNSLLSTSDVSGPFRRSIFTASCETIRNIVGSTPAAELLFGFTDLLNDPICETP